MTERLVEVFPWSGGKFPIEPDASSCTYFWAAACLLNSNTVLNGGSDLPEGAFHEIHVFPFPESDWQIDSKFYLHPRVGTVSRKMDLGDSIMMAVVLAPFIGKQTAFSDLGRLRVQECERVVALRTELTKCGAKVVEDGDTLTVYPSELRGAEIETYNDHRMAMCFAILGLKVPGIKLKNPACVKKTFPNFFQKLAAPPPNGLGVEIRDGRTGRKLTIDELFAD
jgi:3-phosphoshikimate 1-carboxyvinyltransferase